MGVIKDKIMNLYEISNEYNKALNELAELEFDERIIEDSLSVLKGTLEEKGKNVALYIANAEAEQKAIKEAGDKMLQRAKVAQNKIDRLKSYLLENMLLNGITEISSPEMVVKTAKTPNKVMIDGVVDDKYMVEKITKTTDKRAIKAAIDSGENVEGAHLESGYRLVIK